MFQMIFKKHFNTIIIAQKWSEYPFASIFMSFIVNILHFIYAFK